MNHPISVPALGNENSDIRCWPETSPPEHHQLGKFRHSVSLLVWAHNEAHLIESFMERATEMLDRTVQDWEIVFIDDCSTDRTPRLLRALAAREPRLKVFRHMRRLGPGQAYQSAVSHGSKEFCFWQTLEWSYDLSKLRIFLELLKHFDVVKGVQPVPIGLGSAFSIHGSIYRARRGPDSPSNVLRSFGYYCILRALYGAPFHDFQNVSFHGTKRARKYRLTGRTSFVFAELPLRSYHENRSIIEVPIQYTPGKGCDEGTLRSLFDIGRNWFTWGARQRVAHLVSPRNGISRVGELERLQGKVSSLVEPLSADFK